MKLIKLNVLSLLFLIALLTPIFGDNFNIAGTWTVDVQQTLRSNPLIPDKEIMTVTDYLNQISIEFSKTGNYKETISPGNTIRGTWSKYKEDLVVARCENDENIKKAKESLVEKIKNTIGDKRKNIRLRQTLYQLNRFSVKSFSLNTNSIHCQHKIGGNDVTLYFLKLN